MRFGCVLLTLVATACGPTLFVVPGGELRGTVVSDTVDDWGFTDAVQIVQLETRPDAPYSVHIYGVSSGEAFYVASQGWRKGVGSAGDARWIAHITTDPRVRLRVGKMLYEGKAIRVHDESELGRVRQLYQQKYGTDPEGTTWYGTDPEGVEEPPWVYRLDPR